MKNKHYLDQFSSELKSRSGIVLYNRTSLKCMGCGNEHSRFANVSFIMHLPDEYDLRQQLEYNECFVNFMLDNKGEIPNKYPSKDTVKFILNEHSIVINSAKVNISFFKKYVNRVPNKSVIVLELICGECGKIVHTKHMYKKNFIETYFRKLK